MVSLMALVYYYGKFMTRTVQLKSENHNDPTVRKFAKKLEFQRWDPQRPNDASKIPSWDFVALR